MCSLGYPQTTAADKVLLTGIAADSSTTDQETTITRTINSLSTTKDTENSFARNKNKNNDLTKQQQQPTSTCSVQEHAHQQHFYHPMYPPVVAFYPWLNTASYVPSSNNTNHFLYPQRYPDQHQLQHAQQNSKTASTRISNLKKQAVSSKNKKQLKSIKFLRTQSFANPLGEPKSTLHPSQTMTIPLQQQQQQHQKANHTARVPRQTGVPGFFAAPSYNSFYDYGKMYSNGCHVCTIVPPPTSLQPNTCYAGTTNASTITPHNSIPHWATAWNTNAKMANLSRTNVTSTESSNNGIMNLDHPIVNTTLYTMLRSWIKDDPASLSLSSSSVNTNNETFTKIIEVVEQITHRTKVDRNKTDPTYDDGTCTNVHNDDNDGDHNKDDHSKKDLSQNLLLQNVNHGNSKNSNIHFLNQGDPNKLHHQPTATEDSWFDINCAIHSNKHSAIVVNVHKKYDWSHDSSIDPKMSGSSCSINSIVSIEQLKNDMIQRAKRIKKKYRKKLERTDSLAVQSLRERGINILPLSYYKYNETYRIIDRK